MKTALITGSAGNLGRATAARFESEGHRVIRTVTPGKASGDKSPFDNVYPVDLTNEDSVAVFCEDIFLKYQTVDCAVLTAGGFAGGTLAETDAKALSAMISLNFESAFYLATKVFYKMLEQPGGGRIVLIGSRQGLEPERGKTAAAYTLSKTLLFQFARMLNAEGQARNVVTSVVVPSTIDTPENRRAMPDADFEKWVKPEQIAETIAFLCSDAARAVRDPVIKLYGGA